MNLLVVTVPDFFLTTRETPVNLGLQISSKKGTDLIRGHYAVIQMQTDLRKYYKIQIKAANYLALKKGI